MEGGKGGSRKLRSDKMRWLAALGLVLMFLSFFSGGCAQENAGRMDGGREAAEQKGAGREGMDEAGDEERGQAPKIEVIFVHNNPCEACDEEGRFLEVLEEVVQEEGLQDFCEVLSYYAYREPGYGLVEKAAEYFGLEKGDILYPVVIVGDACLLGYDQVRREMAQCLERARENGNREAVVREGMGTAGTLANPESGERKTESESMEFAAGQGDLSDGGMVSDIGEDVVHLLYFYTENCSKCEKAEAFLEQLPAHVVVGEKDYNIVITSLSVAEEDNALYFGALASQRNVPEREQQVPFLFLGEKYLSGETEIRRHVTELLEAGEGLGAVYGTEGILEQQENPLFFLLRTAGVGFLNGFNPCALSLVLLFFSLMAALPEGFLRHGITFLLGKFTAYVLLGMAAARAFSALPFGSFRLMRRGVNLILILFCVGLALGNFLDCFHAFRGEYGKIRVQLPGRLRSRNDRLVKKLAGSSGKKAFGILIFGGSMAVALGEFFCTGQIYLASVLQWIQRAENGRIPMLALIVYSGALCLPALCLLLMISRGKSAVALAAQSLKGMPWIKLCNGILFVIFAVLTLVYL